MDCRESPGTRARLLRYVDVSVFMFYTLFQYLFGPAMHVSISLCMQHAPCVHVSCRACMYVCVLATCAYLVCIYFHACVCYMYILYAWGVIIMPHEFKPVQHRENDLITHLKPYDSKVHHHTWRDNHDT